MLYPRNIIFAALSASLPQTDSMSYLLLPALLEAGLAAETLQLLGAVAAFHEGVNRDTSEMICRSFQHSNYMKVALSYYQQLTLHQQNFSPSFTRFWNCGISWISVRGISLQSIYIQYAISLSCLALCSSQLYGQRCH